MHGLPLLWRRSLVAGALAVLSCAATGGSVGVTAADAPASAALGPNVVILTPAMSQADVRARLDAISSQQVTNQFGTQRFAIFFEPGTYGSKDDPLVFQVGYYTSVAGLGLSPNDVQITGAIDSFNQCFPNGSCNGLDNFWRSLSNLTLHVKMPGAPPAYAPAPPENKFCANSNDLYAVSQAAPIRRVHIDGFISLFDYCVANPFTSGGFIADSEFTGSTVLNGSQQQFIVRNSQLDGWTNGVWNQVFSGVSGAPAQCFPAQKSCGPYTTLATSPVTREAPFLYMDSGGALSVLVPTAKTNSSGISWGAGPTPGTSMPITDFYVASPTDSASRITSELARGKDLILTPGVYHLDQAIQVMHPDTVVLGLGFPTLVPDSGTPAMRMVDDQGDVVSGVIFEAGPKTSPVLLQVGNGHETGDAADPTLLSDVFFRIGGAEAGSVTTALVVNTDDTILDDIWAWRADHGSGVGWTVNTADTGVIVNGEAVTAYGLFVEHFQKYEVIWNGNRGTDVFFQNELPYDPPNQASWMATPTQDGYPAFLVNPNVTAFDGYGLGSYVVFIQTAATLHDAEAFQSPTSPGVRFHDILTVWIAGSGGFDSIIDGTGGPDTSSNPGVVRPVTVVSYP